MTLLELIKRRRSVRSFLDKPVEREKIMTCLEAARLAPSACNSQPWKFIIIDDKQLKDNLCSTAFNGAYLMNAFAKTAPVLVVVLSEKSKFLARIGGMFRGTQFYLIDIGVAVEHFVLQAEELGLGSCWIGWFSEKAVKEALDIPSNKKIDIILALGYADSVKANTEPDRASPDKMSSFNSL